MPEILTYNTPGSIEKKRTKQSIFKSFLDWFSSQDRFTKTYIIVFLLIILATPFIVNNYLETRQRAAENLKSKPMPPAVRALPSQQITITKDGLSPQTVTITQGSFVTFLNEDSQKHAIVFDQGPSSKEPKALNEKPAKGKSSGSPLTFKDPGTFTYHDQLNPDSPNFKGTVIVESEEVTK